ncbi:MAG: ABC transporter ATP-binding protein [Anaerolineales bacterium]|nr:ABC transporter ATP-binding protein [Anaerolineales bacterium]
MDTNELIISTEGLGKSFHEVHALKSLDLRVPPKSIFAFLGPNGAGKTTTIKLLLGLLKPTRGGGKILGMDIVQDSVAIRARIGYLAQDTRFYEHMTARQMLAYTTQFFYAGPQSDINKRVNAMIELVGLEGKADRPIKSFSGGERQRLGIAQAAINYPDLLILDEPAASLDPQGRRDVLEVMSRLSKHATIFYCTHILDDVQRVSDRVAIVNQGELVKQASIQELLSGAGDVTYAITFTGDAHNAYAQVNQQPWVSGIESKTKDGQTTWFVSVTDESAAKDHLLNLLISNGLNVLNFSRKEQNLEDVFLNLIERSRK